MKGHIRQRSKGSWEIAIDMGKNPATGKRRQHFETVRGTKKDAQRRLAELIVGVEKGTYAKSPRAFTFGEYLTEWLQNHVQLHCRPRTAESYRHIVHHYIIPALGQIRLSELKPQHVSSYCSNASSQGLSNRTVLHHFRLLHKAMESSLKLRLIAINPCDGVDPPRPIEKEMKTLSPDELSQFLSAISKVPWPYYYLFYFMLFTGLRRSEALGLIWGDLDLTLCTLSVKQTLHRLSGGKYVMQPPKTRNSRRSVDLSPSLSLLLRDYRDEVHQQRLILGKLLSDDDFVFAHEDGSPLDPSTVTHTFIKVTRKASLTGLRLHDLRHSYASLMLAAGVNVKAISQSMGHANIGITLDTYSHLLPGMGKAAAERFEKLLKPWLSEENGGKMVAKPDEIDTRLEGFEPTTLGSEDRCSVR